MDDFSTTLLDLFPPDSPTPLVSASAIQPTTSTPHTVAIPPPASSAAAPAAATPGTEQPLAPAPAPTTVRALENDAGTPQKPAQTRTTRRGPGRPPKKRDRRKGRGKTNKTRPFDVKVRFTPAEWKLVEIGAKRMGMSTAKLAEHFTTIGVRAWLAELLKNAKATSNATGNASTGTNG